ncbi:MAG: hypothetical protein ACK2U5_04400 [Candidatus Promineifilaceae bacterium]
MAQGKALMVVTNDTCDNPGGHTSKIDNCSFEVVPIDNPDNPYFILLDARAVVISFL